MSTFSIRRDSELDQALAELMSDGQSQTAAVRTAVIEAARQRRIDHLRREAEECATDEADLAEVRAIMAEMETLSVW